MIRLSNFQVFTKKGGGDRYIEREERGRRECEREKRRKDGGEREVELLSLLTTSVALEASCVVVPPLVLVRHLLNVFATLLAPCEEREGEGEEGREN